MSTFVFTIIKFIVFHKTEFGCSFHGFVTHAPQVRRKADFF
jgi:hypothetical protein